MKSMLPLCCLTAALFLSSCAVSFTGSFQSSANLSQANFKYLERNVKGYASATYVLGIGGNNHESLIDEAKEALYESYDIKNNQVLANPTVTWSHKGGLFARTVTCIVSGDIVEFSNPPATK